MRQDDTALAPRHTSLGPVESAVASELRSHTVPQPVMLVAWRLRLPRRSVRYWCERLAEQGLVQLAVDGLGATARWLPDAPPSAYDALGPCGTCPCCSARDAHPR